LRAKLDFARIGRARLCREHERRQCSAGHGRVAFHPRAMSAQLCHDVAREVHHADLVLLGPIDQPPLAKLPFNARCAILKIEVGPLEPETFAQPEAGTQRDEK
jgi:hypothetical protein